MTLSLYFPDSGRKHTWNKLSQATINQSITEISELKDIYLVHVKITVSSKD